MRVLEAKTNKDKAVTVLLALFFGGFGVHRFYLGQTGRGIFYLAFFWTPFPYIVGFIDFILFLVMAKEDFNRKYNPHNYVDYYEFNRQNTPPRRNGRRFKSRVQPMEGPRKRRVYTRPESNDYNAILRSAMGLKEEIYHKLKNSDQFDSGIVQDIKPMVEKYVTQVKELMERDLKLQDILSRSSVSGIDKSIEQLMQKASETDNHMLKYEYQNNVEKHKKHKKALEEFAEQRELIKLRLNSTVISLEQIKFDLVRIENLASEEQRKEFNVLFEEKSKDLSNYLSLLKSSYETMGVN